MRVGWTLRVAGSGREGGMSTVQSPVAGPVKERILVVAQRLFAQGGFSRYGVRDIAREAQVSVSMVSYHFGGKLGILRSIFASFFDQYTQVVESSLAGASDLEQKVECLVRETTRFMKAHENVFRIVATELPHFPDEVAEFEQIGRASCRERV
jgi:AcrR family transcriptional regulator